MRINRIEKAHPLVEESIVNGNIDCFHTTIECYLEYKNRSITCPIIEFESSEYYDLGAKQLSIAALLLYYLEILEFL